LADKCQVSSTITEVKAAKTVAPALLRGLPPYRPVARKLMQLTADASVHLMRVEEVLRMDAAFSAELLRLVNSPLLGTRREITSTLQAAAILGFERIKALTTTLALRMFLAGKPGDALQLCWRRNLAVAVVSERLAGYVDMDSDTCYTAGLLHDVGRLALLWAAPHQCAEILAKTDPGDPHGLDREKAAFGMDHCEAGETILRQWDFPAQLREVALRHHRRPQPGSHGLLPVVHTAMRVADVLGFQLGAGVANLAEVADVLPAQTWRMVLADFDRISDDTILRLNALECSLQ
jgi:putative nucleotidyltransferase with HDIG domain